MHKINNIIYGNDKMDIYLPDYPFKEPYPCVVSIHGGGWTTGDEDSGPTLEHALKLVSQGFMVASIDYPKAPAFKWHSIWNDVKLAINFLVKTPLYSTLIKSIGLIGASAGAHIAAMMISQHFSYPAVLLYGPYDLSMWEAENPSVASQYIPGCFGTVNFSESPYNLVPGYYWLKDTLLIHGDQDDLVNYNQSVRYHGQLNLAGNKSELFIVPGAKHCLHNATPQQKQEVDNRILAFFKRVL